MNTSSAVPTTKIAEPEILTANTYFWKPASSSSGRRKNEEFRLAQVAKFFRAIGLTVTEKIGIVIGEKDNLYVEFTYSESCNNVYKGLEIYRAGKKSNITSLRKIYPA